MKPITEIKKITKAAKKAGLVLTSGKGSHIKMTRKDGAHISLSGSGKKDTSMGVATSCWAFIKETEAMGS